MLGRWDDRPSDPVYYIGDCQIFTTVNSKVEAISEVLRSAVLVMQSDVFSQNWTPPLCVHLYFTANELFTSIYKGIYIVV